MATDPRKGLCYSFFERLVKNNQDPKTVLSFSSAKALKITPDILKNENQLMHCFVGLWGFFLLKDGFAILQS